MKRYGILAGLACAILSVAAVWLGGLNQDEGWYLYAAQMVGEGNCLYRDFFYTQGPLMPLIYAPLAWIWRDGGLLGARILTLAIGLVGIAFAVALVRLLAEEARKGAAAVVVFLLLGCNLYHLYYLAIPKTYALASLFVAMGYYLLVCSLSDHARRFRPALLFFSGLSLAFAAGTRISLGALLAVCGFGLLFSFRRLRWSFVWYGLGGLLGLLAVYGPFLLDGQARAGLCAAQAYHAARGGFDPVFTIGSLSRLVRWYLPVAVVAGWGLLARKERAEAEELEWRGGMARKLLWIGFLAVFGVQMLAPFPYEDYQVPVMGLVAVAAAASVVRTAGNLRLPPLLVLGIAWASSFGSPLLQDWMTDGQDRFWSLKRANCQLAQLQDVALEIERLDPGGKELLTQDLYLAIESGRKVPAGLEMGPFSMLTDGEWTRLLESAPCPVAAMSGYAFAVDPPRCDERDLSEQLRYWNLLRERYDLVFEEPYFGQNSTTLMVLKRKNGDSVKGSAQP